MNNVNELTVLYIQEYYIYIQFTPNVQLVWRTIYEFIANQFVNFVVEVNKSTEFCLLHFLLGIAIGISDKTSSIGLHFSILPDKKKKMLKSID